MLSMLQSLKLKTFREGIEAIDNDDHRVLIQTIYLGAFRESEVCAKFEQKKVLKGWSKPYGSFLQYAIDNFKTEKGEVEKVLLLGSAVAKRTKLDKEALERAVEKQDKKLIEDALTKFRLFDIMAKWKKGELELDKKFIASITGKIYFKTVAVPLNPRFEPWSLEILKYIKRNGVLRFDISDRQVRKIGAKYLKKMFGEKFRIHDLRHKRVTDLISLYHFDPYEVATFTGWSMRTAFVGIGMNISPMLDVYSHLAWHKYFPKLLIPLEDLLAF